MFRMIKSTVHIRQLGVLVDFVELCLLMPFDV